MKTKRTYEEIIDLSIRMEIFLKENTENINTKLGYAIKKITPQITKINKLHNDEVININIDCCAVDADGIILKDEKGNLRYTKEKQKERNKKIDALLSKVYEIESFFCSDLPKDLNKDYLEHFDGIFIERKGTVETEIINQNGSIKDIIKA